MVMERDIRQSNLRWSRSDVVYRRIVDAPNTERRQPTQHICGWELLLPNGNQ